FSTADAARGWAERKARRMKTKGSRDRPNAIAGPAGGASALSEATETTPMTMPQYAGTSGRVANRIARHSDGGRAGRSRPGRSLVPGSRRSALDGAGGESPHEVLLER